MFSMLYVRLTIKVKVGIPESLKVGWYPHKITASSHLKKLKINFYCCKKFRLMNILVYIFIPTLLYFDVYKPKKESLFTRICESVITVSIERFEETSMLFILMSWLSTDTSNTFGWLNSESIGFSRSTRSYKIIKCLQTRPWRFTFIGHISHG